MRYLLDTNIVLRTVNQDDALYSLVSGTVQTLSAKGNELILVPRVIYEFWVAATRPAQVNGLGWSVQLARAEIDDLIRQWSFFEDTPEIFSRWLELVTTYQVSGKQAHDARLVAALEVHGVETLLTLNGDDFKRFDTKVVHPREVTQ